jgi:uncharacterized membrane protein YhaH (DUF805 family)
MVWRNYAGFEGRARRTEYWMFALFNFLAILALGVVCGIGVALIYNEMWIGALLCVPIGIYFLAAMIPSIAVSVRRFHDTGKSGWLLLVLMVLGMIPFLGFIAGIVQIVLLCMDGDPGMNQYGPSPKLPEQAAMAAMYAASASQPATQFGFQPQPIAGESNFGFCTSCGTKLNSNSPFCSHCGAHI